MRRSVFISCLSLLLSATAPMYAAVGPRHRRPRISQRFAFTPWQMAAGGSHRRVPIPDHPQGAWMIEHVARWAPRPDAHWSPAPDPRAINYSRSDGLPIEKFAVYNYFRTALSVLMSVRPSTVVMRFGHIDDGVVVNVNGRRTPLDFRKYAESMNIDFTMPIGRYLHYGRNSIRLMLVDWYDRTDLSGVAIESDTRSGRLRAVLPGDPPGSWIRPTVSSAVPSPNPRAPMPAAYRRGFDFTGWTMSEGNGGKPVLALDPAVAYFSFTAKTYSWLRARMPMPGKSWTSVPDRAVIGFTKVTHVPCDSGLGAFFYFQTRLRVPRGRILRSVRLDVGKIDDLAGAFINGRPVLSDHSAPPMSIPIGRYLHPGTNTVRLFLIDVCELAILDDVRLTSRTASGRTIGARLRFASR